MSNPNPNNELRIRAADILLDAAHRQLKNVAEEKISDIVNDLEAIKAATQEMDILKKQQRKEYENLLNRIKDYSVLLAEIEMELPPALLTEIENIRRKQKMEKVKAEKLQQEAAAGPT